MIREFYLKQIIFSYRVSVCLHWSVAFFAYRSIRLTRLSVSSSVHLLTLRIDWISLFSRLLRALYGGKFWSNPIVSPLFHTSILFLRFLSSIWRVVNFQQDPSLSDKIQQVRVRICRDECTKRLRRRYSASHWGFRWCPHRWRASLEFSSPSSPCKGLNS